MIRNGISVLVACQNEEVLAGWCILSFLDLADEIIVVDNGSTDATKDIVETLAEDFSEKVRFFDVPGLKDLYENRQFALQQSSRRWVLRADSDYVCYPQRCRELRERLLERRFPLPILNLAVPQPNLAGDFSHTWKADRAEGVSYETYNRFRWSGAMVRMYQRTPGFRFDRLGRIEGARYPAMLNRLIRCETLDHPLWMHSDIKSEINMLQRSERTNWRELGDYERFPDLSSYLESVVKEKYATSDLTEAARICFERFVAPKLEPFPVEDVDEKPSLIRSAERLLPVYRVNASGERERVNRHDEIVAFWKDRAYRQAFEAVSEQN